MTSERQLQDRGNSTQEDSLGIQDAQQVTDRTIIPKSPKNLDPNDDRQHLQKLELVTKKLQDNLNSIDANATVDRDN